MSVRLFIGNLPYTATEAELRDHLSSVGEPAQIVLPTDRETGRPRGFAFVEFGSPSAARNARQALQGFDFHGRPLRVDLAKDKNAGRPAPRPAVEELDEVAAIEEKWKSEPGRDDRRPKERGSWKDERHRSKRRVRGGLDDDDDW